MKIKSIKQDFAISGYWAYVVLYECMYGGWSSHFSRI